MAVEPPAIATAVRLAERSDAARWDAYVRSHPEATGYHRWAWRTVFARGLGHATSYLLAFDGPAVVGVLPLVEVRSWLFGRALSSLPYVNYGGVLADSDAIAHHLVEYAARLADERRLSHVLLRHRRRVLPDLPVRTHKVTMTMPLGGSVDGMWQALDRKVRNQVRKGEKSGLTVVTGGEELLDEFYGVFATNMRDLGTPVYGRELFQEVLAAEPVDARLHVVRLGDAPVAGALTYSFGNTIEVPSASSLKEHRALCPNHLMYWSMIRHAIGEGRTRFDFGRSTPDDGTFQFKEQWGASPEPLYWEYRTIGAAEVPSEDRKDVRYQRRIDAWKQLPVALATFIGPHIARCVP